MKHIRLVLHTLFGKTTPWPYRARWHRSLSARLNVTGQLIGHLWRKA